MINKKIIPLLILIVLQFILSSCARQIYEVTYPTLLDGKYDSEFPYRSSSKQLEEISSTVNMLNVIAFYRNYIFTESDDFSIDRVKKGNAKDMADELINYNTTASGTATTVYYQNQRLGLLTCAHIVDFSDTVFTFYDKENTIVRSMAIKDRQINYVSNLPEGDNMDIVFLDSDLDIALMGKRLNIEPEFPVSVFKYPYGKAGELEWGSFVYLMGFPVGHKMITKGIVSSPRMDRNTGFMIDAPFNRGSSGGIVLAIRDGIPNFELVGIANSVSAKTKFLLGPGDDTDIDETNVYLPYQGELFLHQQENIRYGITHIIAIEAIIKSFKSHRNQLQRAGYNVDILLKQNS